MRPRSRFLAPLAALAAGACVPCVGGTLVLLHNLSGASLAINQPWLVEPWDPASASAGFVQRLVQPGGQALFRLPGSAGNVALTCTVHRIEGDGRFHIGGLEVRALEGGFRPVMGPGEAAPDSGRRPPPPGMPTPDAAPLAGSLPVPFLDLSGEESKNP